MLFAIRSLSSQSKRHVVTFSALLSDQLILWRTLGAFDRHLAGSRTKSRGERKTPASNLLNCNSNVHAFVETLITTSEAKRMRPILCSRCSFYGRLNKIRAMHCMWYCIRCAWGSVFYLYVFLFYYLFLSFFISVEMVWFIFRIEFVRWFERWDILLVNFGFIYESCTLNYFKFLHEKQYSINTK